MEGFDDEAIDALRLISGNPDIECTVKSVDKESLTCVCTPLANNDIDFGSVRIVASSKSGTFLIPSIGSNVIIRKLSNEGLAYVALFSEVDEIYLNGDNEGGICKADKVIDAILTIKDAIVQGVPAVGSADGGEAYQTSMTGLLSGLTENSLQSIKNEKVQHGSN